MISPMPDDRLPLVACRGEFSIEEPWEVPERCQRGALRRATDGRAPRLSTSVAVYYDQEQLTIVFSGIDDRVVATHLAHDAPLYEEDVVEAFLAPGHSGEYFELEMNPIGTTFDARITSPDGVRATMTADLGWDCQGLFAAFRSVRIGAEPATLEVVLRFPFASLGRLAPASGEEWRANFFRIDRHAEEGDEFSAWQPTMKSPADFHVVAAFGTLRFA
jgi:hypothetical protein